MEALLRSYIEADGVEWICVRDFLQEHRIHLRPNGSPDTNRFLERLAPGYKLYKPVLDRGRWIVLVYAPGEVLIDTVFPQEKLEPAQQKKLATKQKEMTLVEFFKLTKPDAPKMTRSAILGMDRDLQQLFWATHGQDKKLIGTGGLTLFPTSFLEEHELAAG